MQIDFASSDSLTAYKTLVQTIVPRPVAWVLSDNGNNTCNLAPFSFFNAVTSDPPIISIAIGRKKDGSKKDTWRNIEERNFFTLHIASTALAETVSATSAPLEYGQSEVEINELRLVEEEGFVLPRLHDAPVAMDCELYRIVEVGNAPQGLILGRVNRVYIGDAVVSKTGDSPGFQINYEKFDPLARLGGNDFAGLGVSFSIERPT